MSDMVLLDCETGSKAALVLCPSCGRISRQILATAYSDNQIPELIRPHTCPVCGAIYKACDSGNAQDWMSAHVMYNRNADAYNQSVKENYTNSRKASVAVELKSRPEENHHSPQKEVQPKEPQRSTVAKEEYDKANQPAPLFVPPVMEQQEKLLRTDIGRQPVAESTSYAGIGALRTKTDGTSIQPSAELERKIEDWKSRLLDTGKRNKMINFRETKRSTLRILEPEATELFNKLAFSEKPLTFQKPISKDSDLRTYSMIALMETLLVIPLSCLQVTPKSRKKRQLLILAWRSGAHC